MDDIIVEKKINGVVYRAKYKGIAFFLAIDEIEDSNTSSLLPIARMLFSEVLVSPKVSINDFSDMATFVSVFNFLYEVAHGKFSERKISKSKLKERAEKNWDCWRLVLSDRGFDYQTVFGKPFMTPEDVREANYALDKQYAAEKKAAKAK